MEIILLLFGNAEAVNKSTWSDPSWRPMWCSQKLVFQCLLNRFSTRWIDWSHSELSRIIGSGASRRLLTLENELIRVELLFLARKTNNNRLQWKWMTDCEWLDSSSMWILVVIIMLSSMDHYREVSGTKPNHNNNISSPPSTFSLLIFHTQFVFQSSANREMVISMFNLMF